MKEPDLDDKIENIVPCQVDLRTSLKTTKARGQSPEQSSGNGLFRKLSLPVGLTDAGGGRKKKNSYSSKTISSTITAIALFASP